MKRDLKERTRSFAVRVFRFVDRALPKSKASDVITYQLLKSSSSLAANYRATSRAKSRPDYLSKTQTVLEEADESNFWLNFIKDIQLVKEEAELDYLIKESDELTAIFNTSVKSITNN
jgi:four helix bundle protein